ncbi:MAG TPA: hypothetical protein VFN02_15065, partial [Ktedonobacteraceae bacterium]|nr:hypothetical protein [Ktedonobacteraceae bacterium]
DLCHNYLATKLGKTVIVTAFIIMLAAPGHTTHPQRSRAGASIGATYWPLQANAVSDTMKRETIRLNHKGV